MHGTISPVYFTSNLKGGGNNSLISIENTLGRILFSKIPRNKSKSKLSISIFMYVGLKNPKLFNTSETLSGFKNSEQKEKSLSLKIYEQILVV